MTLEQITKQAMDLPPRQKLALAEFLLESADTVTDSETEAAWDAEIRERIQAIDDGRVVGVSYEEVMRAAELLAAGPETGVQVLETSLDRGMADVAAGRVSPISEVPALIRDWIGRS